MRRLIFITHPEVVIDPGVPVPRWHLADKGVHRMRAFAASPAAQGVTSVWASGETKAIEAAGILAARSGLPVLVHEGLHENDRSATGFLPPAEFQAVADQFFARPHESVRGWEKAADAQARIAVAVEEVLARSPPGDVAIVAHGGVGTLLLCHLKGAPIDRRSDQPFEGHYWSFDVEGRRVLHDWASIAPR